MLEEVANYYAIALFMCYIGRMIFSLYNTNFNQNVSRFYVIVYIITFFCNVNSCECHPRFHICICVYIGPQKLKGPGVCSAPALPKYA